MVLKRNKTDKGILFIDASKEFKKEKNKNVLTDENIHRIFEAYKKRKDEKQYAHLASQQEVEDNGYNLNIPRYVDTSEPEPEIDLQQVLAQIAQDDAEIAELEKQVYAQLRLLGVLSEGK